MVRRTLVMALFFLVALACAAPTAPAYAPVVASTLLPHAVLAPGADPAVVVWPSLDGSRLLTKHWPPTGGPLTDYPVASGIADLQGWYAVGHGTRVTVVWKDGGTVWVKCVDAASGSTVYGPVAVCTDAAVAALDGAATGAALSGAAPDGSGGAYVWCTAAPSRGVTGYGDSLLNHVSAAGALAQTDPGLPVAKGTISRLAADDDSHAFLLLAPPGRNSIATQRFGSDLVPDWANPISPYSPLVPTPNVAKTPIAITAGSGATVAWREGAKVKVQRYPAAGGVAWLQPPALALAGEVRLAGDGLGGAWLAAPSGAGVTVGHVLASGAASTYALGSLGLTEPSVGGLVTNRAGDLFVGYGDLDSGHRGAAAVGVVTWTGAASTVSASPDLRPDVYASGVPDGIGGAFFAGDAAAGGDMLWVGAEVGRSLTFRPRALRVVYGKSAAVGGYVWSDALPVKAGDVTVTPSVASAGAAPAPVRTADDGYYHLTLSPKASALWTATSGAASSGVRIEVQPRVSLALSHLKASTRLSEDFSGTVTPDHRGQKVLIQKAVGSSWKTVASGRLDSRSRFHITWYVPYRTASYRLRAIIPAHADHAQGTSPTARLRVAIRKG